MPKSNRQEPKPEVTVLSSLTAGLEGDYYRRQQVIVRQTATTLTTAWALLDTTDLRGSWQSTVRPRAVTAVITGQQRAAGLAPSPPACPSPARDRPRWGRWSPGRSPDGPPTAGTSAPCWIWPWCSCCAR